jgi:hypothetical protein
MAPKAKKGAAAKPQPGSAPKRAQRPSSKVVESASLDSSDEEDTTTQPAKVRRTSWTTARTERLLDWFEQDRVEASSVQDLLVFSLHLEWLFSQAGENGWHRNLDKDL